MAIKANAAAAARTRRVLGMPGIIGGIGPVLRAPGRILTRSLSTVYKSWKLLVAGVRS